MNKTDQVLNYSALTLPAWLTLNTPKAIIVDVAPEFQELAGIAVDNQGNIYASDSKGNSVYKIAADGLELARWSQCENNNFVSLGDISIDASGNSYFMDKDISFRVCRINTENQTRIVFPTPIQISSIAQGSLTVQGNYIYMIDSSDQRCISKIDKFNSTSTFIPENCDDMTIQFTEPAGIAIDAHNHIYVVDQGAHCIRKVTLDSVQDWAGQCDTPGYADDYGLQAQFTAPSKITIDVQGNMYVIDNSKRIRKINLNTQMVTTLIDSANHAFEAITDIAVGLEGTLYLTDSITNKIYKLTATQVSLTGMPSRRDIGVHPVSLKAQAGSESISDSFNIHVTSTPAPPPFAGYLSLPAPTTPLDFGETVVNVPVTQTLKIRENGNLPLLVELIGISGEQAHEFKIVSPEFPLVLHDGDSAIEITLQCVPTQIGLSTATLMLATNTQDKPTPHYPLTCVGQAPPGYASEPPIGTKLTIAKKAVGHTGVNSFIIKETGGADLIVDIVGITGPHAEDFEVIAPLFPLTISNNDPSATVRVRCLHFDPGLLHEATLTLSTNDPLNPLPSYPLECLGIEAGYGSTPAPESHLDFGSTALNVAVRQAIQVNNAGEQPLTLQSAELYGAHHEDFQLIAPDFPLILDKGEDTEIIVACQPTQTGSRTASLQLNGTDEMQSRYHFSCQGRAEVITAGYASTPPVASVIDFGRTSLTSSVTQTLTIAEVGQVDLEVNLASLEGPQAAAFSISADESIILANDAEPLSLMITCRPVSAGLNTAHLVFTTNDPQNPAPSYELNCYAEATPQSVHYDSLPAPGSQLAVFDSTATPTTEASTSAQLTVMTQGSSPLEISSSALMGEQAEYFHIITGEAPFTVLEEGQAHTLTLQCTASKNHAREAQLILTTNDPKHPTVHYDLICEATQNILFRGEIRTQSGVVSDEVSIDAPEIFTVVGYIYPQAEHIGQKADIKMIYHWQPT
ncbi:MAG: choice-of-anchor D domain-containing protein, partial [Pseudomonadota bacterium]|nr:choice-of-anchor D domain-containing protein [Pseudomonadota bacterium]